MTLRTLTIVGVGLLGGSIGLAAKRRGLVQVVRGVGRNRQSLDDALAVGAIDEASLDLEAATRDADLVILCTPVDRIAKQALEVARVAKPGTLITDVGSTKAQIVRAIDAEIPDEIFFVGGHPLAGSERKGPRHATPSLFEGRWTLLTPSAKTSRAALEQIHDFWVHLGAHVRLIDPEEHDRALALTSHLPHLLASGLAGILPDAVRDLTATGFRDTTRIAAGDPEMWTAIFRHNGPALLESLSLLEARLGEFRRALQEDNADSLTHLLLEAKKVRDALGS